MHYPMSEIFEHLELYEHGIKCLLSSEVFANEIRHCFTHFILSTELQMSICNLLKQCLKCQWNKEKHKLKCGICPDGAHFPGKAA